jgi:hypothetical protein
MQTDAAQALAEGFFRPEEDEGAVPIFCAAA